MKKKNGKVLKLNFPIVGNKHLINYAKHAFVCWKMGNENSMSTRRNSIRV